MIKGQSKISGNHKKELKRKKENETLLSWKKKKGVRVFENLIQTQKEIAMKKRKKGGAGGTWWSTVKSCGESPFQFLMLYGLPRNLHQLVQVGNFFLENCVIYYVTNPFLSTVNSHQQTFPFYRFRSLSFRKEKK